MESWFGKYRSRIITPSAFGSGLTSFKQRERFVRVLIFKVLEID